MEDLSSSALHNRAKAFIPKCEEVKPTTIWVGVLGIDYSSRRELQPGDFIWIKAKSTVTVSKIRIAYTKTSPANTLDGLNWILKFIGYESDPVDYPEGTSMTELDVFGDKCIIFQVVKAKPSFPPPLSRPLQPTAPTVLQPKSPNSRLNARPSIIDGKPNIIHEKLNAEVETSKNSMFSTLKLLSTNNNYPQGPQASPWSANYAGWPNQQVYNALSMPQQRPSPSNMVQPAFATQSFPSVRTPGFELYVTTFSVHARSRLPPASSVSDIERELWSRWCLLPSEGREYYEQKTKTGAPSANTPQHHPAEMSTPAAGPGPTSTAEEVGGEESRLFQLQDHLKDASPETLERSVEEGISLLDDLKAPLIEKLEHNPDAEQWLQQIEKLKTQAVKTKTVIGVVGNTGAGKSSVINAMLDEERLVPTNCMRACTAVVTEISYNYEPEPYRAQIEFITSTDWAKELKTLFQDLLDGDGRISRDCTNEDTDAGIAYAKIRAVYPKKTKDDIAHSSPEKMLREVDHILGTTRDFKETDSLVFYKKLQGYVDSKEKTTSKKDKDKESDKKKEPKTMEFWPLIRVVRINVKSPALATGAVIVDLPGVHDANAARAAVAEGYMKQCTGLWIVAPINRAVDDKAAKSLLGESFKRQLKMDGGFSAVTFICSKTDDISLEEAQDSLGLDDQMSSSWEEMDRLVKEQRFLKKQIEQMSDSKAVFGEAQNNADEQIDIWEALKVDLEAGETVFAPKAESETKKRKSCRQDKSSKKKRRTDDSDAEEDSDFADNRSEQDIDADEEDIDESDEDSNKNEPLNEDQIIAKLQELKLSKKEARTQRTEIAEKMKDLKKQIEAAKEAEDKINSEMSALCISGRNTYSKGAIQQDFAAGIKEIDQELAVEEDEENFNPDAEMRDYEEVARSLPVFCVSSRGYQKLQGRLKKDPQVPGFTNINETEIPQLQAHCEKLTETGRSANCRSFMNKLSQLLNSLVLWSSSDGTGANLTAEQRAKEDKQLRKGLKNLETRLEEAVQSACHELDDELTENVYDKNETAVESACENALHTVLHWGDKVNSNNREAGGYFWSTYKAICRRNGIYSNAQGPHDWNTTLTDPIMKVIASGWEKTFTRRLPMVIANFTKGTGKLLKQFHKDTEARARKVGTSIASLHMLQQQVGVYETNIKDLAGVAKEKVITTQKDINRAFTPVIEKAMEEAYTICTEERGPGSFARMKAAMNSHVAAERDVMFQRSVDEVKGRLDAMIKDMKEELDDKIDEIFIKLCRDYMAVLGGGDIPKDGQLLPKAQRLVRKQVLQLIEGCEKRFKRVAGIEVESDENEDAEREDIGNKKVKNKGKEQELFKEEPAGSDEADMEESKVKTESAAVSQEEGDSGAVRDE